MAAWCRTQSHLTAKMLAALVVVSIKAFFHAPPSPRWFRHSFELVGPTTRASGKRGCPVDGSAYSRIALRVLPGAGFRHPSSRSDHAFFASGARGAYVAGTLRSDFPLRGRKWFSPRSGGRHRNPNRRSGECLLCMPWQRGLQAAASPAPWPLSGASQPACRRQSVLPSNS